MLIPTSDEVKKLGDEDFRQLLSTVVQMQERDRQENQLVYYQAVSDDSAKAHSDPAHTLALFGGNGSSKTETCLVELLICATGIVPDSLKDTWDYSKFRGPLKCRVVVESLTTVLHPIILPKLKWWLWTGVDEPGSERGHWGWLPKSRLIKGKWDRSWSEKLRTLTFIFIDPRTGKKGQSTIQFMSVDQDSTDFASGDFHIDINDEPPPYAIWRENQARTMRVNGRMMLAMTWPDDPAIAVDWIFDEIYDPGMDGPNRNPDISWLNLYTTDNPYLDQDAISRQSGSWSDEVRKVRIYGQPIRFSNRIHPLFTDLTHFWCFACGRNVIPHEGKCNCGGSVVSYNHVVEQGPVTGWPTIFVLDPHPRKPHMMIWVQVSPSDDLFQVAEASVEGDPVEVKAKCDEIEQNLKLQVEKRLIDPNMARSPSSSRRGIVWQDDFDAAGLFTDLADNSDIGRSRLNDFLKPERHQQEPRIHYSNVCEKTIHQMKRYVWDDHKSKLEKSMKQKAKEKNDDYPTMMKYLMNFEPEFNLLKNGAPVIKRAGRY